MKNNVRWFWVLFAAIAPFLLLILVNEYVRSGKRAATYYYKGTPTIHGNLATTEKCTWYCHHNTEYCKRNHLTLLKSDTSLLDPIYNGMLRLLGSTGNYRLANVFFLVLLWPLSMLVLITWIGNMYGTLNRMKA